MSVECQDGFRGVPRFGAGGARLVCPQQRAKCPLCAKMAQFWGVPRASIRGVSRWLMARVSLAESVPASEAGSPAEARICERPPSLFAHSDVTCGGSVTRTGDVTCLTFQKKGARRVSTTKQPRCTLWVFQHVRVVPAYTGTF